MPKRKTLKGKKMYQLAYELAEAAHEGQKRHDGKTPYFDGGRAEEMFTQQLDQTLTKELTKSSAHQIADPMYDLFALTRK